MVYTPLFRQFQHPETMGFSAEFEAFCEAVIEAGCGEFDCEQIARAMIAGQTPEECARQCQQDYLDDNCVEDFEDRLNHDMSMNG